MARFNLSLLHKIKALLSKLQDSKRERRYSSTFSWGEDIELQDPSPALLQDTREHWNPTREAIVLEYRYPKTISTSLSTHPNKEIIVLPEPGISYNTTPPLHPTEG
ncbi:uncharacterized protein AKAW2_51815A [Aspergillus luchuensis]|uniref:Uncharacterized protein n=1 Tax=Aspergillus kawachii TaxID=1069201 RepID=A0A7R7WEF7_ASPKA|nr:uncharacterized protein AKAW2_51815A [Aspergillus luchuensis]BCS01474.1 hypothetical protein AKAW2_51815A [Aspergillus luchuensis]